MKNATLFSVFLLIAVGCNKQNCTSYLFAPVSEVVGPASGLVHQEISLSVTFGCYNGCGQLGRFEESDNGNIRTIRVIAKYEGCLCTQDFPGRTGIYKFKAEQRGTYFLKFEQMNGAYLIDTLVIH